MTKWRDIARQPVVRQAVVELLRAVVLLVAVLLLGPEVAGVVSPGAPAVVLAP